MPPTVRALLYPWSQQQSRCRQSANLPTPPGRRPVRSTASTRVCSHDSDTTRHYHLTVTAANALPGPSTVKMTIPSTSFGNSLACCPHALRSYGRTSTDVYISWCAITAPPATGCTTWTNNEVESVNHMLKQAVQWQQNQIPDLIDKLRLLVVGQQADANRALCGRGSRRLYCLSPERWTSMKSGQRHKAIEACYLLPSVPKLSSSDS